MAAKSVETWAGSIMAVLMPKGPFTGPGRTGLRPRPHWRDNAFYKVWKNCKPPRGETRGPHPHRTAAGGFPAGSDPRPQLHAQPVEKRDVLTGTRRCSHPDSLLHQPLHHSRETPRSSEIYLNGFTTRKKHANHLCQEKILPAQIR